MSSQQLIPQRLDPEQEELRQERRAARQFRRKERKKARIILWSTIGTSIILLGVMGGIYLQIQKIVGYNSLYPPINGVSCDSMEQGNYHIHIHLKIYLNGKQVTIPTGIGIAPDGSCFYWMHTHTDDGIIHIEAPARLHNLALDDFLTIWEVGYAKLNFPAEMKLATGWQIFVNSKAFSGVVTSPLTTEVPLSSHDVVTMEYGKHNPPPDTIYAFPPNLPK